MPNLGKKVMRSSVLMLVAVQLLILQPALIRLGLCKGTSARVLPQLCARASVDLRASLRNSARVRAWLCARAALCTCGRGSVHVQAALRACWLGSARAAAASHGG